MGREHLVNQELRQSHCPVKSGSSRPSGRCAPLRRLNRNVEAVELINFEIYKSVLKKIDFTELRRIDDLSIRRVLVTPIFTPQPINQFLVVFLQPR